MTTVACMNWNKLCKRECQHYSGRNMEKNADNNKYRIADISFYATLKKELYRENTAYDGNALAQHFGVKQEEISGCTVQECAQEVAIRIFFEKISNETRAIEKILTGMRTIRGIKLNEDIKKQLNFDWIYSHKDLVEIDNEYLHTTDKGLLVLDDIVVGLIK